MTFSNASIYFPWSIDKGSDEFGQGLSVVFH
jgi:hypothetical protein